MKRLCCLMLALILALGVTACGDPLPHHPDDAVRGNQIGDLCPATTLTEIGENGYTNHTFDPTERGEITVINFWAYWCPPCVQELPHFERVAAEYTDEVDVIAIHCDDVTEAQKFIAENYAVSSIIFAMDKDNDPFAYYSACGGSGSIPYTVVLDANGIIRKKFVGAINYDKLVAAIESCR